MLYAVHGYFDRTKISDDDYLTSELSGGYLGNIGNLMFAEATVRSVDGTVIESNFNSNEYTADVYLLPAANSLRDGSVDELKYLTKVVNRINKPFVIVGIGGQATIDCQSFNTLTKTDAVVKEFISAVLEHSVSVGVRGEFTNRYLVSLGFPKEKVKTIGCPSLRYYGKYFDVSIRRYLPFSRNLKIAVNYTPGMYLDNVAMFLNKIFHYCPNSFAIMQDNCEAELLLHDKPISLASYQHHLIPHSKEHFIIRNNRARVFLHVDQWIGCLRTFNINSRVKSTVFQTVKLSVAYPKKGKASILSMR